MLRLRLAYEASRRAGAIVWPLRLYGLDVARALAISGMVLVNFKTALQVSSEGPAWLLLLTSCVDGRAAATFVEMRPVALWPTGVSC